VARGPTRNKVQIKKTLLAYNDHSYSKIVYQALSEKKNLFMLTLTKINDVFALLSP